MSESQSARKALAYVNLVLAEHPGMWPEDKKTLEAATQVLQGLVR